MSASRSERPGGTPAPGLELRRVSQLTAGSSALRLPQWTLAEPLRTGSAPTATPLTLVPRPSRAEVATEAAGSRTTTPTATGTAAQPPLAHHRSARPPQAADPLLQDQARHLAQALVEILAGDRTLTQLVRWTSSEVYEQLHHRVHTLASCPRPAAADQPAGAEGQVRRRRPRPRVASLHVSTPTDGVAEVAARVDNGVRSTAVALRLEQRAAGRRIPSDGMLLRVADHRWMCTAVTWV
jgi:hypothetical protein